MEQSEIDAMLKDIDLSETSDVSPEMNPEGDKLIDRHAGQSQGFDLTAVFRSHIVDL